MHPATEKQPDVSLSTKEVDQQLLFTLSGSLTVNTIPGIWDQVLDTLNQSTATTCRIMMTGITECDGVGIALLAKLRLTAQSLNKSFEIEGLSEQLTQLYQLYSSETKDEPSAPSKKEKLAEHVGRATMEIVSDMKEQVQFIGHLTAAFGKVIRKPSRLRWPDAFLTMEKAGVDAVPIIAMIGLLLGLILGFQGAVALKMFGAQIFVANLVSISLIRELGPLITAIILTARSGSAFAAELGTMKVNEELDALNTMALDPVDFLVTTRVLGAVIVTPLLTIFANLFGLIGAAIVMLSLGFPLITYINQVTSMVNATDLMGGLFKSVVFGILVASVGCLRGLQTKTGASAVGDSATRSVVSGIVLIVICDGIFSVLFYFMGI